MQSTFSYADFPRAESGLRIRSACGVSERGSAPWHKPDLIADVGELDFLRGYYEEILRRTFSNTAPYIDCKILVIGTDCSAEGVLRLGTECLGNIETFCVRETAVASRRN